MSVTPRTDGKVYHEEGGCMTEQQGQATPGYVVDTKPDLRVSRVLPWLLLGR